jgi:NADPH2:quinone reductase
LMRAVQVVNLEGPDRALALTDLDTPPITGSYAGDAGVLIDVEMAGVSFTDVLQSRGQYQLKLPVPFVPGCEVAGTVREADPEATVRPGDRVAAFCGFGGFAEVAVAPACMTFKLPDALDAAQGAGLILNYHTAVFALQVRGGLRKGETVLVHGAAGGVGTAALQVAHGLGARTIAVVSSPEKARAAEAAGADLVVRSDGPWVEDVRRATGGSGADLVLDPVGGDRFVDSLRATAETGRVVVVGFAGGAIPDVKVNRLLLGNTSVIGAAWGPYATRYPQVNAEIAALVEDLSDAGFVRPLVGARFPLRAAADALRLVDQRRAIGKVVLEVAPNA